jgi:hypothetical protein
MMLARTTLLIFAVFISHPALAELSDRYVKSIPLSMSKDVIYVFPSLVGLVVAALVAAVAQRRGCSLLVSVVCGALAGGGGGYVTLFTTVVIMLPYG